MPPLISFVGKGKVGKTTFLEKLIPELTRRGYRVATIKHTFHQTTFDRQEKDTARHLRAGSSLVGISSPNEFVLFRRAQPEITLEDAIRLVGEDYDILITEGYKQANAPKIEVHRKEKGEALAKSLTNLVALITDEPQEVGVRQFSFEDVRGVADLIEEDFIKPGRRRISIYVNGKPAALTDFPAQIANSIIQLVESSLKGVGEIKGVDISLRRA